jgi:hypothetical protein
MIERNQEALRLAEKVVAGGIVQKATERLVYQIVEVCAEHERENTEALRARVAKLEAALKDCKRYAEDHDDEWVPYRVDDALNDAPQ